jgi:hypothetical protein
VFARECGDAEVTVIASSPSKMRRYSFCDAAARLWKVAELREPTTIALMLPARVRVAAISVRVGVVEIAAP